MTPSQISQFLRDCIVNDASDSGINADAFYGLYVSWCSLNRRVPVPDQAFRTALRLAGLRPEKTGKLDVPEPAHDRTSSNRLHPQQQRPNPGGPNVERAVTVRPDAMTRPGTVSSWRPAPTPLHVFKRICALLLPGKRPKDDGPGSR
ncbi:hypothetical protein AHiyo1_31240 [Arthrobacter sp. Hiyo1]|uniref:hypothetical protein n=1 Tax=Arthrobacter sp. Hiyo1 TaxID=1588020 RepID=UPI0006A339BA|nr:hypothetical protein [Arthrobacter sp. Hiyo1]GAP59760.1 hypothetical protein AHiyo1_31240 [Arthrobacter sp. Hiyo1]